MYLRRYTNLPALFYLLSERKITLLDPGSWDDSNDSHFLALYRQKKNLKSVLAICFTQADETYHHWRVYAPDSGGVYIKFNHLLLLAVKKQSNLRKGSVKYLKLSQIRKQTLKTDDLPFLKRYAFEHENEFRMIYESKAMQIPKFDIDIPLTTIDRITLSPWVHDDLVYQVKKLIHSIGGCSKLKIVRSTLIGNNEWKKLGENLVGDGKR